MGGALLDAHCGRDQFAVGPQLAEQLRGKGCAALILPSQHPQHRQHPYIDQAEAKRIARCMADGVGVGARRARLFSAVAAWLASSPGSGGAPRRNILFNAVVAACFSQVHFESLVEVAGGGALEPRPRDRCRWTDTNGLTQITCACGRSR